MRKRTHDFLSDSRVHTDPMPSSQGKYLKTQDFLQPLERVGTRAYNEDPVPTTSELMSPPPHVHNHQHVLPGGIGTYTISHIPQFYHHHHHNNNQRVPKPEISNSNSSSGFTLWDESGVTKVNTRTEHRQSFMDMIITSAKGNSLEDDLDDEEDDEFDTKKQNNTCPRGYKKSFVNIVNMVTVDLRVKVDGKGHGNEQKPNTPRSKHSATEQRRRSKINDRFQMLRQLIPNSDQKRDKASFLLEVIEYIHFLQAKVDKHEVVPYQRKQQNPPEETVRFLADGQEVNPMDQQFLNRAIETSSQISQLCPALESEKLREEVEEEELSVHKGTISISSVYSQG
ncbi:unnamed protein product [Cochlearia groenlandica]